MINNIVVIGRLVRDPELRYTPAGVPVTQFTLAVERDFANAQGKRDTDFFDIVAWRKLAEIVANNLLKGRLVAVRGSMQSRVYETTEGQKRKVWEIFADQVSFLDKKGDSGGPLGEEVSDEDNPF